MKGLFNINSKFGHMLNQFGKLILLSLYWILFSLPVFTWGAATCALCTCCRKMLSDEEGKLFHTFTQAFKQNFKQGCIMGIAAILFFVAVSYCALLMLVLKLLEGMIGIAIGIIYLILVIAVLVYIQYVFGYIARFNDSLKTALRNCVFMAIMHTTASIRLAIQIAVAGAAFYFLDLIRYLPIVIMLLPSGYCMISADPLEKVFKEYIPKEEEPEEIEE